MPLHQVPAEPVLGAHRELEVDRAARLQFAGGGVVEGLRIASAAKPSAVGSMAVRQTPLQAIESPGASCAPRGVRMTTRAPPPIRSIDSTLPRSWIKPVNTVTTLADVR